MKILHTQGRIIATATDDYTGPDDHITAPDGFDAARMAEYVVAGGVAAIPTPEPAPMQQQIAAAMTALFDTTAQAKHYDNRITCAMRAGYAGPFHDEGQAFATWMDACNAAAYTLLAEVQAGTQPMPGTVAEALALLPAAPW